MSYIAAISLLALYIDELSSKFKLSPRSKNRAIILSKIGAVLFSSSSIIMAISLALRKFGFTEPYLLSILYEILFIFVIGVPFLIPYVFLYYATEQINKAKQAGTS